MHGPVWTRSRQLAAVAVLAIFIGPSPADAELLGRIAGALEARVNATGQITSPLTAPAAPPLSDSLASTGKAVAPLALSVKRVVTQSTNGLAGTAPLGALGPVSATTAATVQGLGSPILPGFASGNAPQLLAPGGLSVPIAQPLTPAGALSGLQTPRLDSQPIIPSEGDSRGRLAARARAHPGLLDLDHAGAAVVRDEILALGLSPAAIDEARRLGFQVKTRTDYPSLDLTLVVFRPPPGMTAADALRQLQALAPEAQYDLNHLYAEAGGSVRSAGLGGGRAAAAHPHLRIGLIDHGVDVRHPSLSRLVVEQRGFAGQPAPQAHGLATASLLAGIDDGFRSAAPGARLFVADIYGTAPTGGSAEALVRALAWMSEMKAPVINISLVGPPNVAVRAMVEALIAKGHVIVAAAGNDGPNAPPLYPAAYPGVVAVTAVDRRRQVLPEAGRGPHIAFAARGADMAAAGPRGYIVVRGTSFAAPLVAGRLARSLKAPSPTAAAAALAALSQEAVDLGVRGPDPVYGRGLVGADLWTAPTAVTARGALRGP